MHRIDEQRHSRASVWALRFAVFFAALVVVTIAFHRAFTMPTPVALNLFTLAFAGAALAILLGLIALYATWGTGVRGGASALAAIAISAAVLGWPAAFLPTAMKLPRLNDVSTDTIDPPPLTRVSVLRPKGANIVAWPGAAVADRQKAAYPDVAPLILARRADDGFELALEALRRLKMSIVSETRDSTGGGLIEAVDRTLILGFVDDVAVRVKSDAAGSRVDVRSSSRYGRHDFGRNAERVRRVLQQVVARAQATVPQVPGERVARARANAQKGKRGESAVTKSATGGSATRSQIRRARQRRQGPDE